MDTIPAASPVAAITIPAAMLPAPALLLCRGKFPVSGGYRKDCPGSAWIRKGKEGYLSTKDNGNGIGLSAITAAAEKYGGSAKASNSDTEFFVDIVLKI